MIYCFLANGFEEVEAIAPIDMLKRAGVEVLTVGVGSKTITGSHGISVVADIAESEIALDGNLQGIILPGGMPGTLNLENSSVVQAAIDFANENKLLICAICAAPSILGHKGLLKNREAIAFPGFENDLEGAIISKNSVTQSDNFITAKGAGVAVDFGLKIVSVLSGEEKSLEIRSSIQCR